MIEEEVGTGIIRSKRLIPETLQEVLEVLEKHPDVRDRDYPEEVLQELLKETKQLTKKNLDSDDALNEAEKCLDLLENEIKNITAEFSKKDGNDLYIDDKYWFEFELRRLLVGVRIGELFERLRHVRPNEDDTIRGQKALKQSRKAVKKATAKRTTKTDSLAKKVRDFVNEKMSSGTKKNLVLKSAAKKFKKTERTIQNYLARNN